jgi:hypothetical protein
MKLTINELIEMAPAIAARNPHPDVSDRYTHIRTIDLIPHLEEAGWFPVKAVQCPVRVKSRQGFQKHMVHFRREADVAKVKEVLGDNREHRVVKEQNGVEIFELLLTNSHDRSSCWTFHGGVFVQICSNGLVVSKGAFMGERLRHINLFPKEVIWNAIQASRQFEKIADHIEQMKEIPLNAQQRGDFAEYAAILKYEDIARCPVRPEMLLETRRDEDKDHSLWKTFNVVQENIIRGGQKDPERRDMFNRSYGPSIGVNKLDRQLALNQALWSRAMELVPANN